MKMKTVIRDVAVSSLETFDFRYEGLERNRNSTAYLLTFHHVIPFWVHFSHGAKKARTEAQAIKDWVEHHPVLLEKYRQMFLNEEVYIRLNNKYKETHYRNPALNTPHIEFLFGISTQIQTVRGLQNGEVLFGSSIAEEILRDCEDLPMKVGVGK